MSFSATGRSSFAFGSVVVICSCFSSACARLRNMAKRWVVVTPSLRPATPCRMKLSPASERLFQPLGEILDVLRWPARHGHAERQPHRREHFLDLVQRFAPEV